MAMSKRTLLKLTAWVGIAEYIVIGYALSKHLATLDAVAIVFAFGLFIGAIRTKTTLDEIVENQ